MSSAALKNARTIAPVRTEAVRSGDQSGMPIFCDLALGFLSISLIFHIYSITQSAWPLILAQYSAIAIITLLLAACGSYQKETLWPKDCAALLMGTTVGFGVSWILAGLAADTSVLAAPFVTAGLVTLGCLLSVRAVRYLLSASTTQKPELPVVILGESQTARSLYRALTKNSTGNDNRLNGLRVAAVFSNGAQQWPEAISKNVVVNHTQWAQSFVECCDVRCGIVAVPPECDEKTTELVEKSARIFKYLFVAPQIAAGGMSVAAINRRKASFGLQVGECKAPGEGHLFKRIFDLVGALVLSFLTLPFFLFVAIAIRLTSRGPVFYKQLRIGKGNRAFLTLKFRTMFEDSGERLKRHLAQDSALRAQWKSVHKLKNDPRVTPIGSFLRRFSLDELPQIWNVLAGDMSLIGPRPIVVAEIEKYGLDYAAYEAVRPGLTGLWQVSGRNDTTYQQRVDYDAYYVKNWSVGLDARIIARTFRAVLSGAGAY